VEEKNAGKPFPADELCKAVGFRRADDWRFLDQLKSANMYGLIEGTGKTARVELTPLGRDIVAPGSPQQRSDALRRAFETVDTFKRVADHYSGKPIPQDEFFDNTLVREFGIQRARVETFRRVFTANLEYLKAYHSQKGVVVPAKAGAGAPDSATTELSAEAPARTHLDNCFVLMPFGSYFDTYYRDVYSPAIKEAGFEPVRADDLFSTGSIIEQIWEQISKAKVLLAELTGKNPNVFYELGLAHASKKPVVFVTGSLEDVPFDLRHLRVIPYDVHQPRWAEGLAKQISAHLRSCRTEPEKSIPSTFREQHETDPAPKEKPRK